MADLLAFLVNIFSVPWEQAGKDYSHWDADEAEGEESPMRTGDRRNRRRAEALRPAAASVLFKPRRISPVRGTGIEFHFLEWHLQISHD